MDKNKVILIGIDGCTFRILWPLTRDGYLPSFLEIIENGCHTNLISTLPFNTLPAWTSIFTGVNPGKHGITGEVIRENGQYKLASSRDRAVDSLWSILTRHHIKQVIVNEPVTFPPEKVHGIMITGFSTPPQSRDFVYPVSLRDEIEKISHGYETDLPLGFDQVIARSKSKGFQLITRFAKKIIKTAKYLYSNYDWQLFSVIITSTDRLQHFYFGDHQSITSHYQLLDSFINYVISHSDDANIIVVSDHGFGSLRKCFYINTWLKYQGVVSERQNVINLVLSKLHITYIKIASILLKLKLYKFLSKITPSSVKHSLPVSEYASSVDFNRSEVVFPSINGGLFINSYGSRVMEAIKALISEFFIKKEVIEHVYLRKHIVWGPYAHRASDIYLLPKYGYEISPLITSRPIAEPSEYGDIRTGTHRPDGIFIAYGPDIRKGIKLKSPIFTWDIAPIILHMLNLPIPTYMDGKVRKDLFRKGSTLFVKSVKYSHVLSRRIVRSRLKLFKKSS